MSVPCVSVIMGVYNCPSEEMLNRAVESVLRQSMSDFEFIICDDGSDNGTYIWLEKTAAADKRIRLIRNERNMSLAVSLNRCIEAARGRFIARQDIDDYSHPRRFELQLDYLDKHREISAVGCGCFLYDAEGEYGGWDMPEAPDSKDFLYNSPFVHGTMMFRRECFDENHMYRPCGKSRKYEDYDLFMRMYEKGLRFANLKDRLYSFYYDRESRTVPRAMRIDEFFVRLEGFRRLRLFPKGIIYLFKPLIIAVMPMKLARKLKNTGN